MSEAAPTQSSRSDWYRRTQTPNAHRRARQPSREDETGFPIVMPERFRVDVQGGCEEKREKEKVLIINRAHRPTGRQAYSRTRNTAHGNCRRSSGWKPPGTQPTAVSRGVQYGRSVHGMRRPVRGISTVYGVRSRWTGTKQPR